MVGLFHKTNLKFNGFLISIVVLLILEVPWLARKMMCSSSPIIYVSKDEEETWALKTVTFFRTIESSFKLDEEYEETMPSGNTYEVRCN